MIHSLGLIGLVLFIASWGSPLAALLQREDFQGSRGAYTITVIPGLCMAFAVGTYLLVPFHASWMSLWLPLALLFARLCERPSAQPELR